MKQRVITPTRRSISRFLTHIQTSKNGCWIWIGSKDSCGYGLFQADRKRIRAHRFIYKYYNGDIPSNLEINHICGNPSCVNPAHLEAVTHRENILSGKGIPAINARKTHCDYGHTLSGDNLWIQSNGSRHCRACWKRRNQDRYLRKTMIKQSDQVS